MTKNPLVELNNLGQSVWYDNIRRGLLENGEMETMIRQGEVRGVTSNPAIFEKAIGGSGDYNSALRSHALKKITAEEAYERLAVEDVQATADLLQPVFAASGGADGFVSLEVSPRYSEDFDATVREAKRLWRTVSRANLMIKIPGTEPCLPAIRETLAAGVNVNVTLLFSVERYRQVMDTYMAALEDRAEKSLPLASVSSVASFFVSRFDTLLDPQLDLLTATRGEAGRRLRGKVAIANARLAYRAFQESIQSERFLRLQKSGARIQRPLWASTGTKDASYSDVYYIDALIAPQTVSTIPPATLEAYRDHGQPEIRIENNMAEAQAMPGDLAALGISLEETARRLEEEGVDAFRRSFEAMLSAVAKRISA